MHPSIFPIDALAREKKRKRVQKAEKQAARRVRARYDDKNKRIRLELEHWPQINPGRSIYI